MNQKSFSIRQYSKPLSTYYNELVAIFQDIYHRTTSQEGTVERVVQTLLVMASVRVHIFLSGLDYEFDKVCREILRKYPKLDLKSTYAYVRKKYQQGQTMGGSCPIYEHSVMLTNQTRRGYR